MDHVEVISWETRPLAFVIRAEFEPEETTFLTPNTFNFQLGYIIYPAKGEVKRHLHKKLDRQITGTAELIIVRSGSCDIDFYNDKQELVATRELKMGDMVLTIDGGHGFRMREDTVLFEVKQGPYFGVDEKVRF